MKYGQSLASYTEVEVTLKYMDVQQKKANWFESVLEIETKMAMVLHQDDQIFTQINYTYTPILKENYGRGYFMTETNIHIQVIAINKV